MNFLLVKLHRNINVKGKMILFINKNLITKDKIIIFHFFQLMKLI